jgi:hypothetical protein
VSVPAVIETARRLCGRPRTAAESSVSIAGADVIVTVNKTIADLVSQTS